MAQLDFFAAREDALAVLEFLFSATDLRLVENASAVGRELREFASVDELAAAHDLGNDPRGWGSAVTLQMWSPAVSPAPAIQRLELKPDRVGERDVRYAPEGWGLLQLYLGGVCGAAITKSHFGHNSRARARAWGHEEGVDWDALERLSRRVRYHIGRRLAAARVPGRPVLPHALRLARDGYALKEFARSTWAYDLPPP